MTVGKTYHWVDDTLEYYLKYQAKMLIIHLLLFVTSILLQANVSNVVSAGYSP